MVTVVCIFLPLAVLTAVVEFAMKLPEKVEEHREFAMYKRSRKIGWN